MNLPENKPIWTQDKIVNTAIAVGALVVAISTSIAIWKGLEASETCEYAIWLKDNNSLKTVTKAKTIFTYKNDNYVFYADTEGFYKGSLECDKQDGKIHVEAEGYQVYERNFKLNDTMQEIRLIPE